MKKKKYLIGLALAALSLTTLVACGDVTIVNNNGDDANNGGGNENIPVGPFVQPADDEITIDVASKEYDGKPITASATTKSGKKPKLEYKLERENDSEYTTDAPTAPGRYIVKATTSGSNDYNAKEETKEFKISMDMLPEEYKQYENTDAYRKVSNAKEFLDALADAKLSYTSTATKILKSEGYKEIAASTVRKSEANWNKFITKGLYLKNGDSYDRISPTTEWNPDDTVYTKELTYYEDSEYTKVAFTQNLTKDSTVKVIEITADLDLGYNKIKDLGANTSTFANWDKNKILEDSTKFYKDPDIKASGISQIKAENMTDLLIYSKNGAKLTHCGFNVVSSKDLTFKNLDMDEIWMWEDSTTTDLTKIGDYDGAPWAYFKVSHSENITIDHCTFGKSFDGQIDYSNPVHDTFGTLFRAPYGGTGRNSLYVTNCDFRAGSKDPNGYLYKMMSKIEDEYQVYAKDKKGYTSSNKTCRYYFSKRDSGMSFEDILNTYAIPQKKAFLWGDSGDSYIYNKNLVAVLANCTIKNIEDRLPKVRGGMAYVYNVLVDNSEYYQYAVKYGNVSQGILAGLDASVYLESVEYKGIKEYLKNNDSSNSKYPTVNGGYMIKNSIIGDIKGSSTDATNPFVGLQKNSITTDAFSFKVNGEKTDLTEPPLEFKFEAYDLLTNGSLNKYFKEHSTGAI